ncbi:MAG: type II toxin-antitoxin system VapB family antitoxin [Mesorhizobium sp.]|nr:type II toxin-antitoxin system VapB family antitoxin [Mesorhizobium sp.]
MAITIRNKETEELIRKIGRRTGEGPSAVVRRLAENENAKRPETPTPFGKVSEAEVQRRMARLGELRRKYPPPDPKLTWAEVEEEVSSLYAYLDEVRSSRATDDDRK